VRRAKLSLGFLIYFQSHRFLLQSHRLLISLQKTIGVRHRESKILKKASKYKEWGVESLAVPPLGCGNGQLLWETVGPLIYKYLSKLDIPVKIYAPYGTPPVQLTEKLMIHACLAAL
ncbi:MAG: hypothetical protein ABH836_06960, partial [Candidatus Omnitrophota bacterium]